MYFLVRFLSHLLVRRIVNIGFDNNFSGISYWLVVPSSPPPPHKSWQFLSIPQRHLLNCRLKRSYHIVICVNATISFRATFNMHQFWSPNETNKQTNGQTITSQNSIDEQKYFSLAFYSKFNWKHWCLVCFGEFLSLFLLVLHALTLALTSNPLNKCHWSTSIDLWINNISAIHLFSTVFFARMCMCACVLQQNVYCILQFSGAHIYRTSLGFAFVSAYKSACNVLMCSMCSMW